MFESLKYNLKHNRKQTMKVATAWFLFGAIILVFVFWGLQPQQAGVAEGGAAAIVNNTSISLARLSEQVERLSRDPRMEQLQALGGDAGRQILQQQALSQLIEQELIRQEANHQKLWTTDAEVAEVIRSIPEFQEEGRFKRENYMGYLQAVRKNPAEFEDEVRYQQSIRRAVRMFGAALRPTALEIEKQKALNDIKANLDFVAVPTEALVIAEAIPETEVKAYLAEAGSEAKIKAYYDSHPEQFSTPEQVKARHILIQAKAGDAEAEKKALAKIEEIAQKAKTTDFGKLASEFSEDPGSKGRGGDLGFFSKGRMVPEFDQVAFSAPVNEVSQPVKTQYGYHLIQVTEKKPAKTHTLEESREEIAGELMAKDRSKAAIDGLQDVLKKGDTAALNKFVADYHLKWEETGPFSVESNNVPRIGPNDEAAQLAFALSAEKPLATQLIRQGPTAYVLRYKAVPPTETKTAKNDPKSKMMESPEMMAEFIANRRSEDALRLWIQGLQKEARITTNQRFARGAE